MSRTRPRFAPSYGFADQAAASSPEALRSTRLDETLALHPRVTATIAPAWGVHFVDGHCAPPPTEDGELTAPDAGAPE